MSSTREAKALTSILVSGRDGILRLGNDDQNEAGAGADICGFLGSESGSNDLMRRMGDDSQDITVSQLEGRPRIARSA